jgi:uncharacterized membrane protein
MKNFYKKYFWIFFLVLGNSLLWSICLAPQEKYNQYLLYVSLALNLLCFLTGILLVMIEKRKKINKNKK